MCIAVYKPAGVEIPSKKIFENCFSNNDDGAGIMYSFGGKVHIEKGFMTFKAFKKGLKDIIKKTGGTKKCEDIPMVFHFRITSQGAVCKELTHPFPICNDYDEMKKSSQVVDMALAHNGIIDFASSYSVKDHNDTMEFIKEVAYGQINNNKNWYKNKRTINLFDYLLTGNRVVILDGDGHAQMFGKWEVKDGVYYSNSSYSYKRQSVISSGYFRSTSSVFHDYDDDDYYGESIKDQVVAYYQLSKAQEEDFKKGKEIFCEQCGDELYMEWDESAREYIFMCVGCGIYYYCSDELNEYINSHRELYYDYPYGDGCYSHKY